MSYKYILFDLDGTITDPKVGITKSVQYALSRFSIYVDNLDLLEKFIGPPLLDSFVNYYNFSKEDSAKAIYYFREYFKDKGIFENIPYEGIEDLLISLKDSDKILAVSTSKPTIFAEKILKHFNLDKYFQVIVGSNLDNTRTDKAEVIEETIRQLNILDLSEVVMIGDKKHDLIGAHKNKLDAIGVTYGYGSCEELMNQRPKYIVNKIINIHEILL